MSMLFCSSKLYQIVRNCISSKVVLILIFQHTPKRRNRLVLVCFFLYAFKSFYKAFPKASTAQNIIQNVHWPSIALLGKKSFLPQWRVAEQNLFMMTKINYQNSIRLFLQWQTIIWQGRQERKIEKPDRKRWGRYIREKSHMGKEKWTFGSAKYECKEEFRSRGREPMKESVPWSLLITE